MSSLLHQASRTLARAVLGQRSMLPSSKRVVFVYHDISASSAPQHSAHYSTTPENFRRHLDVLQSCFDFVALDELLSNEVAPKGKPLASMTFDDGFRSTQDAQVVLAERKIPFTLFVNSLAIREDRLEYLSQFAPPPCPPDTRFYLAADEVAAMSRTGVQIGSHTSSHHVLAGCTEEQLESEIADNKLFLESLLGTSVEHLALPYGKKEHYDQRALRRCFSAGHRYVYCTNPRAFTAQDLSTFTQRPVPRIGLANQTTQELFFVLNRPLFRAIDI